MNQVVLENMPTFTVASFHTRASRLEVKGNPLSYSEKYTKTFNLFHSMLNQQIATNKISLNDTFGEKLKFPIKNNVYREASYV